MYNYRPLTLEHQTRLEEWEQAKPKIQAAYVEDAMKIGFAIDEVVFCGGEEVPIGWPCEGCERDYEDPHPTHAFDFECVCNACYRVVWEVDEYREANKPLAVAMSLAQSLGLYGEVK